MVRTRGELEEAATGTPEEATAGELAVAATP